MRHSLVVGSLSLAVLISPQETQWVFPVRRSSRGLAEQKRLVSGCWRVGCIVVAVVAETAAAARTGVQGRSVTVGKS